MRDHARDEFLERRLLRIPAQLRLGLGGVAPEVHDVGRTVEVGRDLDHDAPRRLVDALLVEARPPELDLDAGVAEGELREFAHAVLHARRDHEVVRRLVLEDEPHARHIVLRVAPVAQGVEVAQKQLLLLALRDAGSGERDLPRHERLAAPLGFVVEEDARAGEHPVGFAVLLDDPEAVELRDGVGRIGMERRALVLRHLLHLAVQLGGRGLVDAARLLQPREAHGLQDAQDARRVDVRRELGHVERDLHMALRREVVDLVGADGRDDLEDAQRVAEVAVVEVEARPALQMGDPLAVVGRTAPDDAVDLVALLQQKLREVAAVLSRHAGNQRFLRHLFSPLFRK